MVDLILDLAGYTPDRELSKMVAIEPSAGDGSFLSAMTARLVESCRRNNVPLSEARKALQAFEIDPAAACRAEEVVRATLRSLQVDEVTADDLAREWIIIGDFLENSLCFPIADFVIGNPPYIRLEEIPESKANFYRSAFNTMRGRADIYIAFYQAALQQLKPGGVCAYICADRWMLNDYGKALRKFITTEGFSVKNIIEAHDIPAFESEVNAYPAVTLIANEIQGSVTVAKALPGIEFCDSKDLIEDLAAGNSSPTLVVAEFPDWFGGTDPWPCSSPERLKLLKHLEANCFPLECESTGTRIGIGVATGADRVYISSDDPDIEPDRVLPLALATDLSAGRVEWSGNWMANPWNENGLVDLADYPRLESHLRPHHERLVSRHTARKDKPQNWHKTIDRVNLSLFGKDKLYIADIKDRLLPAIDLGETYPQHNLYWITSEKWDLRVLGALLMSAVGDFFIQCYGVRMRGGYLRFQAQYLRRIRVPDPDTISGELSATLRRAFDTQDFDLATMAALQAYQIEGIPQ